MPTGYHQIDPSVVSIYQHVQKWQLNQQLQYIAENFQLIGNFIDSGNSSTWYTGPADPTPTFGKETDIFLNTTTYDLFQLTGGVWVDIGNLRGDAGVVNPIVPGAGIELTGGEDTLTDGPVTITAKIADDTLAGGNTNDTVLMTPLRTAQHLTARMGFYPWMAEQNANGKRLINVRSGMSMASGALTLDDLTVASKTYIYTGAGDNWNIIDMVKADNASDIIQIEIINDGTGAITLVPTTVVISGSTTIPAGSIAVLIFYYNSTSLTSKCLVRVS